MLILFELLFKKIALECALKEQLPVDHVNTGKRKNTRVSIPEGECLNLPEMLDILKHVEE